MSRPIPYFAFLFALLISCVAAQASEVGLHYKALPKALPTLSSNPNMYADLSRHFCRGDELNHALEAKRFIQNYIDRVRGSKHGNQYPESFSPATDTKTGWTVRYIRLSDRRSFTLELLHELDEKDLNFRSFFECSAFYRGSYDEARRLGLYVPTKGDGIFYASNLGLYIFLGNGETH